MESVAFNMCAMVYQQNYGAITIDEPVAEGFYVMQFTSITYKL